MASFYGRGCGTSPSGGTTNYNELKNKPIINLNATTPIDLSALEYGLYSAKGTYTFNAEDGEVKTFPSPTFVAVLLDTVSGDKIVTYDVYENGKHLTYSIDYYADGSYNVDKYSYEAIDASAGTTEELPEIGDATKIYSTEDGLYVWNETKQGYVRLGSEEEEEQTWDEM